jgi:hypothetical protein
VRAKNSIAFRQISVYGSDAKPELCGQVQALEAQNNELVNLGKIFIKISTHK